MILKKTSCVMRIMIFWVQSWQFRNAIYFKKMALLFFLFFFSFFSFFWIDVQFQFNSNSIPFQFGLTFMIFIISLPFFASFIFRMITIITFNSLHLIPRTFFYLSLFQHDCNQSFFSPSSYFPHLILISSSSFLIDFFRLSSSFHQFKLELYNLALFVERTHN